MSYFARTSIEPFTMCPNAFFYFWEFSKDVQWWVCMVRAGGIPNIDLSHFTTLYSTLLAANLWTRPYWIDYCGAGVNRLRTYCKNDWRNRNKDTIAFFENRLHINFWKRCCELSCSNFVTETPRIMTVTSTILYNLTTALMKKWLKITQFTFSNTITTANRRAERVDAQEQTYEKLWYQCTVLSFRGNILCSNLVSISIRVATVSNTIRLLAGTPLFI